MRSQARPKVEPVRNSGKVILPIRHKTTYEEVKQYSQCAHALKQNPQLKGNLAIRFAIDATGRLVDPEVVENESSLPASELTTAVLRVMRKWKDFGAAAAEQKFQLTYSFGAKTVSP